MYNSIISKFLPVFLATLSGVALGQITEVDSLEHDTQSGIHNSLVRVNDDTYALAYRSGGNDGHIKTFTIPADGSNIIEVDSLEHDTRNGLNNSLVRVNDNTIALAYRGNSNDGFIKTFTISADGSNIIEVFSLEHDSVNGFDNSLVRVDDDTYALAYRNDDDGGYIKTFTIPADGSIITEAFSLKHDSDRGMHNSLVRVDDDTYALAYRSDANDGFIKTFTIPADGSNITQAFSLGHDLHYNADNSLVRVDDDTYALAYRGPGHDGFIKTFTIPADGSNIIEVDLLEHDIAYAYENDLVKVDDDTYALAYRSRISSIVTGLIKTFTIPADGLNITQVDSLPFNNQNDGSLNHSLVRVDYDTYALAYRGTDSDGFIKTFTIAGSNTNQPTVTSAPTVTTIEDTEYTFGISDFNLFDADGNALDHIEITSLESAGTLYLDADNDATYDSGEDVTLNQDITAANITLGLFRFTPAANANGSAIATFAYKVNDGEHYSSSASTMTINATAVDDVPIATAQTVSADEDVDKTIILAGTEVDGEDLTYKISTLPSNGTLYQTSDGSTRGDAISSMPTTVSDGSHRVIYRSAVDGNGDNHGNFGFKVNDGNTDSGESTVTVNVASVNDDIVATAQTVSVNEDTDLAITLAATDVDGRALSYQITTLAPHGTLYQTSDGTTQGDAISSVPTTVSDGSHRVIYRSAADGNGDDHGNFGFKAFSGSAFSSEATVTVDVAPVNDVPVAIAQTVTVNEDTDGTVTLTGNDVDGDNLSYKITTLPSKGTLYQATNDNIRGDIVSGIPADVANAQFKMIYVSALNGNGNGYGNFTFTVNDGTTDSDTATVTVNVTAVNDAPVATAQTVTADEDLDKVITLSGTDIEGSALTSSITTLPSNGTLYQANSDTSRGDAVTKVPTTVANAAFNLIYVSALNGNGDGYGNFAFKINDGTDDSDAAAVTVNVSPVDDPPTVANPIADVAMDEAADSTDDKNKTTIDLSTVFTDLDNEDSDIIKSVQVNTNDTLLTASVNVDTDSLILEQFLEVYGNTTITVRGTSNDLWVEDEFNIIVSSVDYELSAATQTVTVNEDFDVTIALQGSDEDSRDLIFQITTLPANGTLFQTDDGTTRGNPITSSPRNVTSANQQVIYAADPHQFGEGHGNYGFRVTTEDGSKSREAEITVDVISVNDPPLDIALTPNSVEEGLDPNSYVGKFTTSDADIDDRHTYKFEPGEGDKDNDNFKIEGDSLFTLVEMNFPTQPTHFIRVSSTDDSLAVIEEAMTVLVIGEGMTSPAVFPDQKFTLSEYSAIGTKVGEIEGDDIDIGDILQDWRIVSGDDKSHFAINNSTGTLTTAAILNFEDTPFYTLGITTSDNIYTSPVENIVVQVTDVEEGIIVSRTTGLITSEHEESDTFTVVLESAPLEDVIIPLSSSDISEVSIFPDSLIFTSSGWSEPKTVTLTGIDDSDTTDGNIPYSVILASTISSDPNYNGIDLPDVAATNIAKDIQGPKVTIQPFDPGYATVNLPITINASITDVNEISSAILFYFTGGNTKTGIIVMNVTDVGQYEATIPGDAITPMGIHFNIVSVDKKGNQSISNYSIEINFPEGKLSTDITGSVLKDGLPKNKWRLISVPARLDDNNVVAVLGDALGKKKSTTWDVRQLKGKDWDDPYEESTELEPGKGYWLIHDVKAEFPFTTGSGYSLDQTKFEFELQPLWNMIGNPYPFRVKIEVDETNFYGPLTYGWTGEGWSSPVTELQPWSGYVIYNRSIEQKDLVLTPVLIPSEITMQNVTVPDGWKLNIGAYGKTYVDPGNAIGRLSGSLEGLDFRDNPEPPYMGGYVSVVMPRDDWSEDISNFTSDIRSLAEPEGVWDIQLRVKEETSPVTLSMDMEGAFPVEHDIVLLDLINRKTHHIKKTSSVTLNQNWDKLPVYPFKIVAGSPEYVSSMTQEILSQLPETFTLHQNYPNPFNPVTSINYEIPTDQRVTLSVYNILGQEVISLVNKEQFAGKYTIRWDGTSNRLTNVSSGTYFYVLQTNNFKQVKKMVLLK
mgnify:CR=1 FL=1